MRRTFLLICGISLAFAGWTQPKIPQLWGHRVHDEAGVLSQAAINQLEVSLKQFEESTSNQVAVLIISSLEGTPIEQYAIRVAHDEWKLGQAKNDNGALLLLSVEDREVRIEVGQGLEGVLTDAMCSQIIRNEMYPRLRQHDYDNAVASAVQAIEMATKGEYKGTGRKSVRTRTRGNIWLTLAIIILFIILRSGRRGGGGRGWSSAAGWFLLGSAGGWRGGGGGGGGFSGGGGSFGGGGASGRW